MNIFSVKSIGLYSLAIGSAIGFFQIVTSYGEANIKAPISIAGDYLINTQNLPGCLDRQQLTLKLQQSGIYLNASLINNDRKGSLNQQQEKTTFSGRLHDRQLDLVGLLPTDLCPQRSRLQIAGSLVANLPTSSSKTSSATDRAFPQLQGQIWLTSPDLAQIVPVERPVDFTATLQRSIESAPSH